MLVVWCGPINKLVSWKDKGDTSLQCKQCIQVMKLEQSIINSIPQVKRYP